MRIDDKDFKIIANTDLKLLLEQKRGFIGRRLSWDLVVTGLLFALPLIPTTFDDLWGVSGNVYKWILISIGFAIVLAGIIQMAVVSKKNYTADDLYSDMVKLEPPAKRFSLVAIKDTFNKYPNRYLLYYDEKWDCKFFPNCKTLEEETANKDNVIEKISVMLNIPVARLSAEFKAQDIQHKFAPADNTVNIYDHKLYEVTVSSFPKELRQSSFSIGGKQFFWLTIDEMLKDKRIYEMNLSVVSFVKDNT